jgi:FMN phosphatase YigB (HAD superfamily)
MIKLIALDLYGTLLSMRHPENPPRKGANEFFKNNSKNKITVVTASDVGIQYQKKDLEISLGKINLNLTVFDRFYCLDQLPVKDYSQIMQDYKLAPAEILVIDDSYKGIIGAKNNGCCYFQVPEYWNSHDDFDLSRIIVSSKILKPTKGL